MYLRFAAYAFQSSPTAEGGRDASAASTAVRSMASFQSSPTAEGGRDLPQLLLVGDEHGVSILAHR